MTIDLSKMSVVELKAFAYDQLATQEVCLANLRAANQQIAQRLDAEKAAEAAPKPEAEKPAA